MIATPKRLRPPAGRSAVVLSATVPLPAPSAMPTFIAHPDLPAVRPVHRSCLKVVLPARCLLLAGCASEESARIAQWEEMLEDYRNPALHLTSYDTGREVARRVLHGRQADELSTRELVLLAKAYNFAGQSQKQLDISELILRRDTRHAEGLSLKENATDTINGTTAQTALRKVTSRYPYRLNVELPGFVVHGIDEMMDFPGGLSETLRSKDLGQSWSGVAMLNSSTGSVTGWVETVYVADVEKAVPEIRRRLIELKAPRETTIVRYEPVEIRWSVYTDP